MFDLFPKVHNVLSLGCFFQIYHVRVILDVSEVPLRKRLRDVYDDFFKRCSVKYIGVCNMMHQNISGVKYPVDFFIQRFYERRYPNSVRVAMEKYRRVNPSLVLRLDNLNKYANPHEMVCSDDELDFATCSVIESITSLDGYVSFIDEVKLNFEDRMFNDLNIDGTSAAGYPYDQGIKRRDVMDEAIHQSNDMLDDDDLFDIYAQEHKWYATGRARLIEQIKEDKGRLILYAGFSYMLIAMLFVQPLARLMNTSCDWCAVGMSWMNGGAAKFASYFKCDKGYAPDGFRYVSVDIKEWDTKLHPKLMARLFQVHAKFVLDAKIGSYGLKYLKVLADMIASVVLMPMGHVFQIFQGMKSGWANTANDNTLIHEIVFRIVQSHIGCDMLHLLYGDDNFILVPDHVTDEMIVDAYLRVGCIVGRIHSSTCMGDVDFLAKYVIFRNGQYVPYRPAVETNARLIMPEEMNPGFRNRPDPIVVAERALGHLLDNPFNLEVRTILMDLLRRLNKYYGVGKIFVTPEMRKSYPWKGFASVLPEYMPICPTVQFIEELYGVGGIALRCKWSGFPSVGKFSWDVTDYDCASFYSCMYYSYSVVSRFHKIGSRRMRKFVKAISPLKVPRYVHGTHAGRLECVCMEYGIVGDNALDLGAHPGACTNSFLKLVKHVTCVSLQPHHDDDIFCPYVIRGEDVDLIEGDADIYVPPHVFDIVHDDIDISGSRGRTVEIRLAREAIKRANRYHSYSKTYIFTLRDMSPDIMESLYELYKLYGSFDIVKPHYSNPWRLEFVVVLRKLGGNTRRKKDFLRSLYGFLNVEGGKMMDWCALASEKMQEMHEYGFVSECPYRNDVDLQKQIAEKHTFKIPDDVDLFPIKYD